MTFDQSSPLRRSQLMEFGVTDGQIGRSRRAGELVAVRRGCYVIGTDGRLRDAAARHALLVAAGWPHFARGSVLSHGSAAVIHGLPVWSVPLGRVHVTRSRSSGGRIGQVAHLHSAALPPTEVVERDGFLVTSPAWTVIDLARSLPFEVGVAVADAALRMKLVEAEGLARSLACATRRHGASIARRVVDFADGRSESVGESRSRVALARAGLPPAVLQWEVRHGGALLGRVDFAWPDCATVAEFDGQVKYGRWLRPGQDPGDAVFREKRREDRLRDQGLGVVRWTWRDLAAFDPVAARLRRRLT